MTKAGYWRTQGEISRPEPFFYNLNKRKLLDLETTESSGVHMRE